jgi:hypothetical protein
MIGICHRGHEGDAAISLDESRTEYWPRDERAVLFGPQPESTSIGADAEVSPSSLSWHLHSRRLTILMSFSRSNQPSSLVIFDDASFITNSLRIPSRLS